jgi:hypothetical protein
MVVRISKGTFDPTSLEDVERLAVESEQALRNALQQMLGLVNDCVGIEREVGSVAAAGGGRPRREDGRTRSPGSSPRRWIRDRAQHRAATRRHHRCPPRAGSSMISHGDAALSSAAVRRRWSGRWMGGAVIGIVNGTLREGRYRVTGERRAHEISPAPRVAALATYFWPLIIAGRYRRPAAALQIGATSTASTMAFKFGFGRYVERIPSRGQRCWRTTTSRRVSSGHSLSRSSW